MDIVPTTAQWTSFASPRAATAYWHWPFLATPNAPQLIEGHSGGSGEYIRLQLERVKGSNAAARPSDQPRDRSTRTAEPTPTPTPTPTPSTTPTPTDDCAEAP